MKNVFYTCFLSAFILGCDPNSTPTTENHDASTGDASVVDAGTTDSCVVGSAEKVCADHCGTFSEDFGCGTTQYDCPAACTISHTCHATKHICCVDIDGKIDLFCKYYPYYNSTFTGAGATPSHDSATRIPSPNEVGFTYCRYPGFVNCSRY
jgi:hypothetical protein